MCRRLIYLASFVLVLGMVLTSVAQAGLVAWWRLDDASGSTAQDRSGKGHHGTAAGTPTWVSGAQGIGGALAFGPGKCHGVDCGLFDPTNGTGQFTITFWAFWEGTGSTQRFVSKANSWGPNTMMFQTELWAAHSDSRFTDRVGISYKGKVGPGSFPFSLMPKREWAHLAFTFDGTNATVLVNGVDDVGPQAFSIGPNIDAPVLIGARSITAAGDRVFEGSLDDVRIYDSALTPDGILETMYPGPVPGASAPSPADGAIDGPRDVILSWMAGDYAETHDVYFGTVFDDVNDASKDNDPNSVLVSQNQVETTYEPPGLLEFGQRYYWRVDEVNALPNSAVYKGDVWSFTIVNFLVLDDFESYNDLDPGDPNSNRIFMTWIDGLDDPANGSLIGYADPPFAEQSIVHGGEQSMPYYYDNTGTATNSQAQRSFSPGKDWTREGVDSLSLWFRGHPAYVGSFVEAPAGTYTMTGSGADIWGKSDEFHFAYKEISGAAAIIAKVESVGNTDPWAKAGVMIRDTLEPDSRNAALLITPENGVRFQYRKTAGGTTDRSFKEGITAPQWVRLERTTGGLVRAFYSADGSTWMLINMTVLSMNMPVYIGLAVSSHNIDATCEAKFSNVSFPDTGVGPQWTDQDIGMLSNEAEPMYATVADGSGRAATVYHDDPDAALIDTWTEWNIPLTDFINQGVVLTDISKLAIGFGGADNPQPGGAGLMHFDDIRLYLPR
jgi:regulation of enolase protein 1 (concanavalin A-like superfamily)